jgi:hypothetical protein
MKKYDFMKTFEVFTDGKRDTRNYDDITRLNVWVNYYGNPSYGVYLSTGEKLLLVDDYGFCTSYAPVRLAVVKRKKDL